MDIGGVVGVGCYGRGGPHWSRGDAGWDDFLGGLVALPGDDSVVAGGGIVGERCSPGMVGVDDSRGVCRRGIPYDDSFTAVMRPRRPI